MSRVFSLSFCLALSFSLSTAAFAATVDFESVPLGTEWGTTPGNSPGDLVLTEDSITMTVENFTSGAFVGFNAATIDVPPQSFFPPAVNSTQALTLNNINGKFDFTGLPFAVSQVTVEYADGGDTNNFDVNGLGKQEVNDLTTLTSYAGFAVNVTAATVGFTDVGTIEVIADPGQSIQTLELGGQESSFDNLLAVPEPTSLLLVVLSSLIGLGSYRLKQSHK